MNEGTPQADTKPWQEAASAHLSPDAAQLVAGYWRSMGNAWSHWANHWQKWAAEGPESAVVTGVAVHEEPPQGLPAFDIR